MCLSCRSAGNSHSILLKTVKQWLAHASDRAILELPAHKSYQEHFRYLKIILQAGIIFTHLL